MKNNLHTYRMRYRIVAVATSNFVLFIYIVYTIAWSRRTTKVDLPYVFVHLDLKGSPPKLVYLESILPLLKKYGVNGLLIEYEDMFPYEGKLVNISSRNHYKKYELKKFLLAAANLGLEIIPLIQTFGHLEHVLKLPEFHHLREVYNYPDSICPSRNESFALLRNMLEQVIHFHKQIAPLKYIHIGCDEVFHINSCNRCADMNLPKMSMFLRHVTNINKLISSISPGTSILIWDDMLRKKTPGNKDMHFANMEPVYWDYSPNLHAVRHVNLYTYHKLFENIWIASAFKGADGGGATLPKINNRISNNLSWMQFIQNNPFYDIKGIILTGWSRYSHMAPPCELLPVAMPSLIANLILIKKYKEGSIDNKFNVDEFYKKYMYNEKEMSCNNQIFSNREWCEFDGDKLFTTMVEYEKLHYEFVEMFYEDEFCLSSYQFYKSTNYNDIIMAERHLNWTENAMKRITKVETKIAHLMAKYYDDISIDEYVGYKISPWKNKLHFLSETLKNVLQVRTWERRP